MNEIGEQLINKSIDFGQQIQRQLGNLLKQKENELEKLMKRADGVDIKECTKISKNLGVIALATMSNVSSCIVDKIELGGSYIESLSKIANDVLSLPNLKDILHCPKSVTDTIKCVKNAGSNAAWIGTHIIPDVISRIGKLSILMGELPVSVPSCAVSHGYNTFTQQYEDMSRKINNCVDKKMAENPSRTEKK
ncbi:uncharacterized protein [Chelonus insularis]|nr:uncharacterized protein LOC118066786 isoform X2 [Chelonus insularis]XP_034939003.1 uncharacterized protein LOC118066786 isoform X2 [Chelonus insularis]